MKRHEERGEKEVGDVGASVDSHSMRSSSPQIQSDAKGSGGVAAARQLQLRPTRPLPTRPTPSMHPCLPPLTMTRPKSPRSPNPFMGGRNINSTHTRCTAPTSASASTATCAMPPTHPDSGGGATSAITTSATTAGCGRSRPARATLSPVRHTDGSCAAAGGGGDLFGTFSVTTGSEDYPIS